MVLEKEQEFQKERIVHLLQTGDRTVWKKSGFPKEHRPDIEYLSSRIKIGTTHHPFELHPELKPEITTLLKGQIRESDQENAIKQIAWYDHVADDITFI